jgi:hypothetical protein
MEIWKEVNDFSVSYSISNYGKVLRNDTNKILKIYDNGIGYKMVSIKINHKYKILYLHRLVAKYFIDNPNNYLEVNHVDFDKSNNTSENLEWCNRKHNMNHYYKQPDYSRKKLNTCLIDYYKPSKKWRLRIRVNGERKHIGLFSSYEIALYNQNSLDLLKFS